MGIMVTIFTHREVGIWRLNNMLQITKLVNDSRNIHFAELWLSPWCKVQAQKRISFWVHYKYVFGSYFILMLFSNSIIQLSLIYNMLTLSNILEFFLIY